MAINLNVGGNTQPLEQAVQAAVNRIRRTPIKITVDDKGATQPLGNMKRGADEFSKSMEAANARIIAFGASMAIINGVGDAFKAMVRDLVQVEKALADINVVMGLSSANLDKFSSGLFRVAKETGAAFNIAAQAATEYARQGLTVEESLKRTRDALILTRLTGMDSAEAVKSLTAAMNTYGAQIKDTTQLVSKFAAVDVKFAVSAEDFADAIARTGQAAKSAGVDIDQLIGLVTAAQQQTARGGKVIGNSFKTIFTRIGRTDTLNQLENLGIAVRDLQGNTLGATRILTDLANTFDKLTASQQAQIAQTVGGVFQINILKAVLSDAAKQNGILADATRISSGATDDAIRKNEQLRQTMSAVATETGLALKEVSARIGEIMLAPGMEKILNTVKSLAEGVNAALGDGESGGNKFAKGFLAGLGNVISGPGLIVMTAVFGKLMFKAFQYARDSLKSLIGVTSEAQKQKAIQTSLLGLFSRNAALNQEMLRTDISRTQKEQIILNLLKAQVAEASVLNQISARSASMLQRQGFGPNLTPRRGRAGGHIPNYAEREMAARGGYAAGTIRSMNMPGEGRVTFNSAETVKNFAGLDQPAIMPPKGSRAGKNFKQGFMSAHGFNPYAAGGYIPNYAKISTLEPTGTRFGDMRMLIAAGREGRKGTFQKGFGSLSQSEANAALRRGRNPLSGATKIAGTKVETGRGGKPIIDVTDKFTMFVPSMKHDINRAVTKNNPEIKTTTGLMQSLGKGLHGVKSGDLPQVKYNILGINPDVFAAGGKNFAGGGVAMEKMLSGSGYSSVGSRFANSLKVGNIGGAFGRTGFGAIKPEDIQRAITKGGGSGAAGALSALAGAVFEAAINSRFKIKDSQDAGVLGQVGGASVGGDFDVESGDIRVLKQLFGPTATGRGDYKISSSLGNRQSFVKKVLQRVMFQAGKGGGALLAAGSQGKVKFTGKASDIKLNESLYRAGGFIPNFADPLSDAIGRERGAGVPVSQIRVGAHSALRNRGNPMGLGVTNTVDEPNGLRDVFGAGGVVPNYFNPLERIRSSNFFQQAQAGAQMPRDLEGLRRSINVLTKVRDKEAKEVDRLTRELAKSTNSRARNRQLQNELTGAENRLKKTTDALSRQRTNQARAGGGTGGRGLGGFIGRMGGRGGNAGMAAMFGLPMVAGMIQQGAAPTNAAAQGTAGAMSGAASGAMMGMMVAPLLGPLAPLAPVLGGVLGAAKGLISGLDEAAKASRQSAMATHAERIQKQQNLAQAAIGAAGASVFSAASDVAFDPTARFANDTIRDLNTKKIGTLTVPRPGQMSGRGANTTYNNIMREKADEMLLGIKEYTGNDPVLRAGKAAMDRLKITPGQMFDETQFGMTSIGGTPLRMERDSGAVLLDMIQGNLGGHGGRLAGFATEEGKKFFQRTGKVLRPETIGRKEFKQLQIDMANAAQRQISTFGQRANYSATRKAGSGFNFQDTFGGIFKGMGREGMAAPKTVAEAMSNLALIDASKQGEKVKGGIDNVVDDYINALDGNATFQMQIGGEMRSVNKRTLIAMKKEAKDAGTLSKFNNDIALDANKRFNAGKQATELAVFNLNLKKLQNNLQSELNESIVAMTHSNKMQRLGMELRHAKMSSVFDEGIKLEEEMNRQRDEAKSTYQKDVATAGQQFKSGAVGLMGAPDVALRLRKFLQNPGSVGSIDPTSEAGKTMMKAAFHSSGKESETLFARSIKQMSVKEIEKFVDMLIAAEPEASKVRLQFEEIRETLKNSNSLSKEKRDNLIEELDLTEKIKEVNIDINKIKAIEGEKRKLAAIKDQNAELLKQQQIQNRIFNIQRTGGAVLTDRQTFQRGQQASRLNQREANRQGNRQTAQQMADLFNRNAVNMGIDPITAERLKTQINNKALAGDISGVQDFIQRNAPVNFGDKEGKGRLSDQTIREAQGIANQGRALARGRNRGFRNQRADDAAAFNRYRGSNAVRNARDDFMAPIQNSIDTFDAQLTKTAMGSFRDGMVGAMKAAIQEGQGLKDVLLGAANSFLTAMQNALFENIANMMMARIFPTPMGGGGGVRNYGRGGGVPAMISNGEYVMGRRAVNMYGGGFMHSLNARGKIPSYNTGGAVGSALSVSPSGLMNTGNLYQGRAMSGAFYAGNNQLLKEDADANRARMEAERRAREAKRAKRQAFMRNLVGTALGFGLNFAMGGFGGGGGEGAGTVLKPNHAGTTGFGTVLKAPAGGFPSTMESIMSGGSGALDAMEGMFTFPKRSLGGGIRRYAPGGFVNGKSGIDQIPAMLSEGEYVIKSSSVRQLGTPLLDRINAGKFNDGGPTTPIMEQSESAMGAGGNTNNINISVNVGGGSEGKGIGNEESVENPADSSQQNDDNAELAKRIKAQVVNVIREEQRPGGLLGK